MYVDKNQLKSDLTFHMTSNFLNEWLSYQNSKYGKLWYFGGKVCTKLIGRYSEWQPNWRAVSQCNSQEKLQKYLTPEMKLCPTCYCLPSDPSIQVVSNSEILFLSPLAFLCSLLYPLVLQAEIGPINTSTKCYFQGSIFFFILTFLRLFFILGALL